MTPTDESSKSLDEFKSKLKIKINEVERPLADRQLEIIAAIAYQLFEIKLLIREAIDDDKVMETFKALKTTPIPWDTHKV